MEHISTNVSGPWLLAGDFNIISFADERSGGSHVNMGAMGDFNLAIFNCSLGDVEFDGPPFTWTYGRVWQRLDRALMNQQWSSVFVEYLGRGLQNFISEDGSRQYSASGGIVPFLAFADDLIIFTRASEDCLRDLLSLLHRYQSCSGQRINVAKSSFTCSSRVSDSLLNMISDTTGYRRQFLPFVYLGVPIDKTRLKCIHYDGLVSKIRGRISHWSSKLLSMGGKIILLRHVLGSMPLYLCQVMDPSKAIIISIARLFNAFLWDDESWKIHWTSWEKLCFPKEEGGLGFRSLEAMVQAFSCKLWWNFRLQVSPWAKFMLCKYAQLSHPSKVELGHSSAIWRRLVSIRETAEPNIRWCLGEGLVDFWYDRWLLGDPLYHLYCPQDSTHFLVAEFFYWGQME
ncbi:uncharacterized protein [Coffea arabica]|uniref:Reverse transcriptase domain-containing protein n=1 Tax=Coffea arabica TaxID=13443 RepID=A0ABM4VMA0_COFAR